MTQTLWKQLIQALPKGKPAEWVASIFRRDPVTVRRILIKHGYELPKKRKYQLPEWVCRVDWKQTNAEIAKKFKISRERVRQFRKKLGKPKVGGPGSPGKKGD